MKNFRLSIKSPTLSKRIFIFSLVFVLGFQSGIALASDLSGSLDYIDPYSGSSRISTLLSNGCSAAIPFGVGSTTDRHVCINDPDDGTFYIYTSDPVDGNNFGAYSSYTSAVPSAPSGFLLTLETISAFFSHINSALLALLAVFSTVLGFRYLFSIVSKSFRGSSSPSGSRSWSSDSGETASDWEKRTRS